jgi:hypothetical protein
MTQQEFFNRYSYNVRTDKIGGGSFGTVYKAYDNVLDRTVAIKVSEVKVLGGKEFSLLDEFDAIKDLPLHPNIANYEALYNFDQANGIFDYAVIQYYPDGNLKDLIKQSNLSKEEKETAALQVLAGVEFLHNHRVVHRDMKPSNILIQARNQGDKVIYIPKITDFGLSKKADPSAKSRFTNSFGGGTLEYSSPEQLKGQNLRFNTDLWAWAVITYELFTGNPMFKSSGGGSDSAEAEKMIFDQILNSEILDKLSDFPDNWKRALSACLDRNPETRVKTAEDIRAILRNEESKAAVAPLVEKPAVVEVPEVEAATRIDTGRQMDAPAQPEPVVTASPAQATTTKVENKKSKAPMFIGIGVGSLAIIGIAIFFMMKPAAESKVGLTAKQENELYGYAGPDGAWVIEPKFITAEAFSDGLALVRTNDSLYYINEKGEMQKFVALVTLDPVDADIDDDHLDPHGSDDWKNEFERHFNQLIDSEHSRTDQQNLKEYQNLLKTVPSGSDAEKNRVNSRIKYFQNRVNNPGTTSSPTPAPAPAPTPSPSSNRLTGLTDSFGDVYDYVGDIKDGRPNGTGTATYKNGMVYTGAFVNGFKQGKGTFTFASGSKYVGDFVSDKRTGSGTYTWTDGSKYVGNWKDNEMHGKGVYTFPGGAKYDGEWSKGNMHGYGIYYYADGSRYDGQWKNDKKHGWGKFYNSKGVLEYEGRYEDDKRLF